MAEACYKDPYLPASYKAIPFTATEVTSTHGRRGAEGEFPFGERTAYADLGRKIRVYTLRGRFDGNDHVLQAAALIAACELPQPGPLVHPTRGVILSAACRSLKVIDDPEEQGGVTTVEMEFVEANNWPNGLSLVGQLLGLALSPLITAARANFSARYQPTSVQAHREAAVVGEVQAQVSAIADAYQSATVAKTSDLTRNQILNELRRVSADPEEARDTTTAERSIALGMNAVALETSGADQFEVFRGIANGAADTSSFDAPASTSQDAVFSLVRSVAAAFMADALLNDTSFTRQDLFTRLDAMNAVLDGELDYARVTCANHLYSALASFRDSATAEIYRRAYQAPGVTQFNFGGSVHPLNAAYQIYGDAKKSRELQGINTLGNLGRFGSLVRATGEV